MNYARARGIIRKYQVEGTVQKEMEEEVRPGAHCPERTVQSDRRTARSANKPEAKSTLLSPP